MKTVKMSLANIQGKMSRKEMKSIMAGSGGDVGCGSSCTTTADCSDKRHQCMPCQTGPGKGCTP